jgi:hypothetical protein
MVPPYGANCRTAATRSACRVFISRRPPCPLRDAWLAAKTDVRPRLLRVEVGDHGEHASVVVGGLWESERAEDAFDVLLDGVVGDE